ncbi:MAG: hypothetical protein ACTS73_00245 [Arsenophonus sp. NEOnobi-MAG3]
MLIKALVGTKAPDLFILAEACSITNKITITDEKFVLLISRLKMNVSI